MRILPSGEHAVLVELDDLNQARALAESLRRDPIEECVSWSRPPGPC
jgi:hypothetical protein